MMKRLAASLTLSAVMALMASAGFAADEKVKIDVGGGKTVEVSKPIRLAYFAFGTGNSWLQTAQRGVEEAVAAIPGASVVVFDPVYDGVKQFNQMQTALQSGRFNAAIVDPINSQLMCDIMTKGGIEANVAIVNIVHPICSKWGAKNEERYTPGTLAYVDANDSMEELQAYVEYIAAKNPGPQKMITLSGPDIDGMTKNIQQAFKNIKDAGTAPNLDTSNLITTNFSLNLAHQKLVPMLQANPDTTLIWAPANSDVAHGALVALGELGMTGKVKIYEKGGNEWIIDKVRGGEIEGSQPQYPYEVGHKAVEVLAAAFDGKPVPRFVPDYGVDYSDVDKKRGFQIFEKDSSKEFKPRY